MGSWLSSLIHEFEAVPDVPAPAGADAVAAPEPEPVPAGAAAVEPEPTEPPAAEPTEEEMQAALAEFVREQIYETLAGSNGDQPYYDPAIPGATPGPMAGYPPAPTHAPAPYAGRPLGPADPNQGFDWTTVDPYSEDFGARLGVGIESTLQRLMGTQLAPVIGSIAARDAMEREERGGELVADMLEAELTSGPDLTDAGKSMLEPLAEAIMPGLLQKGHPRHPRTSELAIRTAAQQLRALEAQAASRGVTTHNNTVANLATAPQEPQPAGAAAVIPTPAPAAPLDPAALARKFGLGR